MLYWFLKYKLYFGLFNFKPKEKRAKQIYIHMKIWGNVSKPNIKLFLKTKLYHVVLLTVTCQKYS